jgi:hypothetical protein
MKSTTGDASVIGDLREVLLSAATFIEGIGPGALGARTPCVDWCVIDVIDHLASVTEKFGRFAAGERGVIRQRHGGLIASAPAHDFRVIVESALSEWDRHPDALEAICLLPFGSFDGRTVARINVFDAVFISGISRSVPASLTTSTSDWPPPLSMRQRCS